MVAPQKVDKDKTAPKVFDLPLDRRVVIGRSDSCHITINKPEISSSHAVFFYDDDSFWIIDNDSANGTLVNGTEIKGKNKLKFNDVVKVGDYYFTFICEFVHNIGKKYYLEINKKKFSESSKTRKITAVNVIDPEKKETLNKKSKKKEEKKKAPKAKTPKKAIKSTFIKQMGSDVASRVKSFSLTRQQVVSSLKKFSFVSILCHIVIVYFLGKYFIDTPIKDDIREISINLKDPETPVDIPDIPDLEITEPEIKDDLQNPEIQNDLASAALSSIDALQEAADDVEVSDSPIAGLTGIAGDIQVGKGYKGVRDGSFIQRISRSKGRYKGVDVRLTLIWNGYSDLDLHVMTPHLETIYYGRKQVGYGRLDIDQNAKDPVRNPVENVIWNEAEDGEFTVSVMLFDPRKSRLNIPFKIEFAILGDVYYYKGSIRPDQVKEQIQIVKFACKDKRYKILESINDQPVKIVEEELDLIVE